MDERTDLHLVSPHRVVCVDCLGALTSWLPGPLCARCLAARQMEALTSLWSPEDRQALARVIDVVNLTTPAEDVAQFWRFVGEIAELRH